MRGRWGWSGDTFKWHVTHTGFGGLKSQGEAGERVRVWHRERVCEVRGRARSDMQNLSEIIMLCWRKIKVTWKADHEAGEERV